MDAWNGPEHRYFVIPTRDGSPSVAHGALGAEKAGEPMHSLAGAWGETDSIYGSALDWARDRGWPLRLAVVGLGLGMIEARAARGWKGDLSPDLQILSWEADGHLVECLQIWLEDPADPRVPSPLGAAYQNVMERAGAGTSESLLELLRSGRWKIKGALDEAALNGAAADTRVTAGAEGARPGSAAWRATVIAFDAYSGHTSPALWDEGFLRRFLRRYADENCILTTYAAKGTLKRALLSEGFTLTPRPGYAGKRESTWAVRGA
ncbi:MAG TPA: MnmC family methyltransferase [Bdellovibrionota bacterium]|jgi:hypothetical protein|nr:MnmC family methyltransferase [Bdellovibrionota bacterium]